MIGWPLTPAGPPPVSLVCTKQDVKLHCHMGNDVLLLSFQNNLKSNVCGELLFSSLILALLLYNCGSEGSGGGRVDHTPSSSSTFLFKLKKKWSGAYPQFYGAALQFFYLFYSDFVLFYQHYKALLYVYFFSLNILHTHTHKLLVVVNCFLVECELIYPHVTLLLFCIW